MQQWFLDLIQTLGYPGIFLATLVENTVLPVPSELTLVPAAMLAAQGQMSYAGVLFSAVAGIVAGSLVNYWVAVRFGRGLLMRYGRYILFKPSWLAKTERFFVRYGAVSMLLGRLIPGFRHYLSFVAGLGRMKLKTFVLCTALGGTIWVVAVLEIAILAQKAEAQMGFGSLKFILGGLALLFLAGYVARERLLGRTSVEEESIHESDA